MKTHIESVRGTRYIITWKQDVFCSEVLRRICNYYCRANKNYEVTFVLGHGSRFLTVNVDCLLLSRNGNGFIEDILAKVHSQNITGIRTENKEEAEEIEQEIMKGYEWAILKS